MKKLLLLTALLMCYAFNMFAEYNVKMTLDANSFFAIHKYAKENNKSDFLLNADEEMVKLYVKVNTDYKKSDIEMLGGTEIVKTKSIALIQLPIKNVDALSQYDYVEKIDIVKKLQPLLDKALQKTNVDAVHLGTELESSYTGKGVIVGVGDLGIDFRHAMFSDTNGVPRVKRAWCTNKTGTPPEGMTMGHLYTDSNEIKNVLRYSSNKDGHGTHVLGIAAGTPVKAQKATYSGVAKDADIVVVEVGGSQEESTVLEATAYMFRYADSVGKPISINYSLRFLPNTHASDGESLFDIAISELLQENPNGKIITAGAGNEGNSKLYAKADLENSDSAFINIPFSTEIFNVGMSARLLVINIWGEENKPFTADLYYKNGNQQIKYKSFNTDEPEIINGEMITVASKVYVIATAEVTSSSALYPNNKPSVTFFIADVQPGQSPDSCYIVVKGSNTSIYMWSYVSNFSNIMSNNFVSDGSYTIGSPAAVEEVICVGAYISRTGGPYHGEDHGEIDDIAGFSSRGPLTNGKIKPDITAPGIELVSANNNFYSGYDAFIFDKTSDNNNSFISIGGTSMSSPMVAGIVALMLEKKPNLTQAEAKEIIRITAINDQYTGNVRDNKSPVWGWGKINAQEIMNYLEKVSIDENLNMDLYVFPNPTTNFINVIFDNPTASNVKIDLIDAMGQIIRTPINKYCDAGIQTITVSDLDLSAGAYFIRMHTNKVFQVKSFIVE